MSERELMQLRVEFPVILGIESMVLVYAARQHNKDVLATQIPERHMRQELFGRIHIFLRLLRDPVKFSATNDLITKQYGGAPEHVGTLLTKLATRPSICDAIKLLREIGKIPHCYS
jgi:hypothetical protein